MTDFVKSTELRMREYAYQIGLDPLKVYYQKRRCENISTAQAQWDFVSPNKRAVMLSYGQVNWKPTVQNQDNAGAALAFVNNAQFCSFKPVLPFANSMSSVVININGASETYSQPRRFMDCLNMMHVGRRSAESLYDTAGGGYIDYDGFYAANSRGLLGSYTYQNRSLLQKEWEFQDKLIRVSGGAAGVLNGQSTFTINCLEPLIVPPFNPYALIKDELNPDSWFKKMSYVVPNVSTVSIEINFQGIEGCLLPRFMAGVAGGQGRFRITALAADLVLWWYDLPLQMSMPKKISLQSWKLREFPSAVGTINNEASVDGIQSQSIQLDQMPGMIIIHAEVDKDSATSYLPYNWLTSDDDVANTNPRTATIHGIDSFPEIYNLQVVVGDVPEVISTNFTQEELYELTLKNSVRKDFCYAFSKWRGQKVGALGAVNTFISFSGKCFVALKPQDIAAKFPSGIQWPTTMQFTMSLKAHDGLNGITGNSRNASYKLYVHTIQDKHYLELTPDSGVFKNQALPPEVLLPQAIAQGAVSAEGQGLVSGGYVSRM
jgi:hypothetical protein